MPWLPRHARGHRQCGFVSVCRVAHDPLLTRLRSVSSRGSPGRFCVSRDAASGHYNVPGTIVLLCAMSCLFRARLVLARLFGNLLFFESGVCCSPFAVYLKCFLPSCCADVGGCFPSIVDLPGYLPVNCRVIGRQKNCIGMDTCVWSYMPLVYSCTKSSFLLL